MGNQMSLDDDLHFEEKDIVNKKYFEGIKSIVTCPICLDIIRNPVQCNSCQNCFCLNCIQRNSQCPFRCQFSSFPESLLCKKLLSEIIIKCKCGEEIGYDFIEKHKKEDCEYQDYKEKYLQLKKEYDKLMNLDILTEKKGYNIKSYLHPHVMVCNRHFLLNWSCDNCKRSYNADTPSYNCTLCNYDLCYTCAANSLEKGMVLNKMPKFYEEYNNIQELTKYSLQSILHAHPIEYVQRPVSTWECNNCETEYGKNTYSFHCTLCDFNLCYDCAKGTETINNTLNSRNQNNRQNEQYNGQSNRLNNRQNYRQNNYQNNYQNNRRNNYQNNRRSNYQNNRRNNYQNNRRNSDHFIGYIHSVFPT